MKHLFALLFLALAGITSAHAQGPQIVPYCNSGAAAPNTWVPCNATYGLPVAVANGPVNSTMITGNSTGTTGAVVGTLTAVTGKTTYICGFNVSAIGGTAAVGPITIANTITASLVYELASSTAGNSVSQTFTPCIPASATGTSITITTTADGTASAVAVNAWGYNQ